MPSKILKLGADGKTSTVRTDTRWGAGMAFDSKRRLIICEVMVRRVTRVEQDGTEQVLAESYDGRSRTTKRSGRGCEGRDLFHGPALPEQGHAELDKEAVYYISPAGKVLRVADDVERPNGIALARDGKALFVADTAKSNLRAYPVKADGTLDAGRDSGSVPGPDGVRIDSEG